MSDVGAPVRRMGPRTEGTVKDLSVAGRRAAFLAPSEFPEADIDARWLRGEPPGLPEVSEIDLIRHYTGLSQENYGVDTGVYPLGSCTMKYNPKVAEAVAGLPGFQRLHP